MWGASHFDVGHVDCVSSCRWSGTRVDSNLYAPSHLLTYPIPIIQFVVCTKNR